MFIPGSTSTSHTNQWISKAGKICTQKEMIVRESEGKQAVNLQREKDRSCMSIAACSEYICMCLNAQNLCMSSCKVHLLLLLLYVRDRMSQGRLQQSGARGHPQEKKQRIKSCHIFTRSICGNQAAGKAEEDKGAEQVAVSTLYQAFSQPRRSSWSLWATFSSSDSMAARLSISGSCRYNERKRHINIYTNLLCTTLKISGHD